MDSAEQSRLEQLRSARANQGSAIGHHEQALQQIVPHLQGWCFISRISGAEVEMSQAVLESGFNMGQSWAGGILFFSLKLVPGAEVEKPVKLGDDVTLYSDCVWKIGFNAVWFRNCSHEHQPPLIITSTDLMHSTLPRYSAVWNPSNQTHDLLVKNVTESDLGLYYCAIHEKKVTKANSGVILNEDVYHYGNTSTRLSLSGKITISDLLILVTLTPSIPPVSDCSICWKLLVSVCPVCVLLSSTCVHCIYRNRSAAQFKPDQRETDRRKSQRKNEAEGEEVCYAALDLPSRGQKRLKKKKKRVETSDFSTYSEVRTGGT
ncbi:hypothetical protein MHYP_G00250110 [Metynnis hypsauchen]